MRSKAVILVALCGLAAPALAQDSVSNAGGSPGDALDPYDTAEQVLSYVVRPSPLSGSMPGSRFGIAPIVKASRLDAAAGSLAVGANGVSADQAYGVPAASGTYATWTQAGPGVNAGVNTIPQLVGAPNPTNQFAVLLGESGTDGSGEEHRGAVGAIINRDPTLHRELLVTRTVAAVNRDAGLSSAFVTTGSVDAAGNAWVLGDGFGSTAADALAGDDVFRIDLASRGSVLNRISDDPSTMDATDALFGGVAPSLLLPPSALAESVTGAGGLYAGLSFAPDRFAGQPGAVGASTSHLSGNVNATRGGATTAPFALPALGGVSTQAAIGWSGVTQAATEVLLWGVDAAGGVTGSAAVPLPIGSSVSNAATGASFALPSGASPAQFGHYRSVNAFEGGGGQVALGRDPYSGDALAAGTVLSDGSMSGDPSNAVVVRRFDPQSVGSGSWELVAHVDPLAGTASDIWGDVGADGVPGTLDAGEGDGLLDTDPNSPSYDAPMGTLLPFFDAMPGSPNLGPSISGPAIDAGGDVYFVASVGLNQPGGSVAPGVALLRGRSDGAGGWRLELVLAQGQVVRGQDSGLEYEIRTLLGAVDSASGGAAAPGTVFSSAAGSFGFSAADLGQAQRGDPRGLGALVIGAEIVYDRDANGQFDDPADEAYESLLWLGYLAQPADLNTRNTNPGDPGYGVPDEEIDGADLSYFVEHWLGQERVSDLTTVNTNPGDADHGRPDGVVNGSDLSYYVEAWLAG